MPNPPQVRRITSHYAEAFSSFDVDGPTFEVAVETEGHTEPHVRVTATLPDGRGVDMVFVAADVDMMVGCLQRAMQHASAIDLRQQVLTQSDRLEHQTRAMKAAALRQGVSPNVVDQAIAQQLARR